MKSIVILKLTHRGHEKKSPSKRNLKVIECTISNAIENGDLDLTIGAGTPCLESSVLAESPARFNNIVSALELAEGWIDAHRDDDKTGDGQQDKFVLDCVRAALNSAKEVQEL